VEEVVPTDEFNYFAFIVDRSGSMNGHKMSMAKEAMVLFLQSLPMNSLFDIVSFGNKYESMTGPKGWKYDEKTKQ